MGKYLDMADDLLRKAAETSSSSLRNRYRQQASDYEQIAYRQGEVRAGEDTGAKAKAEGKKYFEQARSDLTSGYGKAKTTLQDKMASALKNLTDRYVEIDELIKEEAKGAAYDPARRVTLAATPIRQGIDQLARTLMDFSQRTGSFGGSGSTRKVIEQSLSQLVPLASQETKAAFEGRARLGREARGHKATFAGKEAGMGQELAFGLSDLERGLGRDLSAINRQIGGLEYETGLRRGTEAGRLKTSRMYMPISFAPQASASRATAGRRAGGGAGMGNKLDDLLKLQRFQQGLSQRATTGGSGGASWPLPIRPGTTRGVLHNEASNKMKDIINSLKF